MKTVLKSLIFLLFTCTFAVVIAQDGEQLYKAKCNTCHMIDKNSTGPMLKGAKQKWNDAGEGELIYEWVKNPANLIASGKSQMANTIKSFSQSEMPGQSVSKEEIDAILTYVDTYVAPTTEVGAASTSNQDNGIPTVKAVPNYNENLTLFYWLLTSIAILLIAILIISSSITTLIKSDYFKKKIQENKESQFNTTKTTLVLLLIGSLLYSTNTNALTFYSAGEAEKGMPYLKVENIDIYFLVGINLVLLGVLIYLRRMFREFMKMVRPEIEQPVSSKERMKKLNTILTDAVAIEEEHSILMEHEYDGIRELDNNLPPWWVWGFFGTIVFAFVYLLNYHVLQTSDLQYKAYEKEITQAKKDIDLYLKESAMNIDETNVTLLTDKEGISNGKELFGTNCVACHNTNGEGNIGPNLTDKFWLYSPDIKDIFKTIKNGTPNGMPEHASKLNPAQLQQVASFVLSLPYTNGKAPDGKEYKK